MPSTLYRYILTEVTRIVAISAAVLVLVMAFAAAIKPLSEGMLGADTLLKFVVYMSPSMLQYALPFAAAMGATLVYIRMSQDNEIVACLASGLNHRQLVAPMAFLGAAVMALLLVLSGGVAPSLYRLAERTACGDIVSTMVRRLNQGQPFVQESDQGGMVLFANQAWVEPPPPEAFKNATGTLQPEYVVMMKGVAVGQLDKKRRVASDMTASSATAMLYRDTRSGDAMAAIRFENPQIMTGDPETDGKSQGGTAKAVDHIHLVLPNMVQDKVEFMSAAALWDLLPHPEHFDGVRRRMDKLAGAVAAEKFRNSVAAGLAKGVPLRGPLGGETFTVTSPVAVPKDGNNLDLAADAGGKVVVEHRSGAVLLRRWEGESGRMHFKQDSETDEPVVELKLTAVRVSDPAHGRVVSAKPEYAFDALAWPEPLLPDVGSLSLGEWLEQTEKGAQRAPALAAVRRDLINEKEVLWRKVIANANLRVASALMCLLLSVLGATMSLWRRTSLPLVVFFWCFLFAVVSIILINTGASTARGEGARFVGGLALVWVPIVGLAGFNLWILRRLGKPGA